MTTDTFEIKGTGDGWAIHHAGDVSIAYATQIAALEAASIAGADALRLGNGLMICVDPAHEEEAITTSSAPTLAKS